VLGVWKWVLSADNKSSVLITGGWILGGAARIQVRFWQLNELFWQLGIEPHPHHHMTQRWGCLGWLCRAESKQRRMDPMSV